MTWSIVARDAATGAVGVAVATRSLAVGGLAPYGAGRVGALSTQARVNPLYGVDGLRFLSEGRTAREVVAILVGPDEGRDRRQLHVVDAGGGTAAHTGAGCVDWAGHVARGGASVAGNMLAGAAVVHDTLEAFEGALGLDFAERLLAAMDAGEAAGGDKRGKQSAALKVWQSEPYPALDLRTDDHPEPLAELRRLHGLARERYIPVVSAMATRTRPFGIHDTAERDRLIAAYREKAR